VLQAGRGQFNARVSDGRPAAQGRGRSKATSPDDQYMRSHDARMAFYTNEVKQDMPAITAFQWLYPILPPVCSPKF
jgi:hypothetical protein